MIDQVDAAIAAATQRVEVIQTQIALPPHGRPAALVIPRDITAEEAYQMMTAVAKIIEQVRASNPAARLVDAKGGAIA